ncbi:MAG: archaeosortase/exosortase family protein [Deltaproteobacteria bacterium]|nr:archaeosortase/exosortase family protein [Deltaproteobacteria bacterium]
MYGGSTTAINPWRTPWRSPVLLLAGGSVALLWQYAHALAWLLRTFTDQTYDSWGGFPLALAALLIVFARPKLRAVPRLGFLGATAALSALDLLLAPLGLNIASAGLGLFSANLLAFAFFETRFPWYRHPVLLLTLLALPVSYWLDVLAGYPLKLAASSVARQLLAIYGLPVVQQRTQLVIDGQTFAVDSACSGLKFISAGLVLGVLISSYTALGTSRAALFWLALLGLLFFANALRIVALTLALIAQPINAATHYAIGCAAFALACAVALLCARLLSRNQGLRPACQGAR